MKSKEHETLGDLLAAAGRKAGADLVIRECQHVDRLFIKLTPDGCYLIAGEVEMTERNCIANNTRNLRVLKASAVLTICPNGRVRDRVTAKLAKHLPERFIPRVAVFTAKDLETGAVTQWISLMVNRDACLSLEVNNAKREMHHERSRKDSQSDPARPAHGRRGWRHYDSARRRGCPEGRRPGRQATHLGQDLI